MILILECPKRLRKNGTLVHIFRPVPVQLTLTFRKHYRQFLATVKKLRLSQSPKYKTFQMSLITVLMSHILCTKDLRTFSKISFCD